MKILISPMSAIAETAGPFSRCKKLAEAFKEAGMEVATCIAKDVNYKEIEGIQNYDLDIPMPFGMPKFIASRTFPVAQKLGITSKKTVNSFDQVLLFTGNLDYDYLKKSVHSIRKVIQDFQPDLVYSEFNLSAIIAAKKEGKQLLTTISYPTQPTYAQNPKLAGGLNRLLKELGLAPVPSALHLFQWADHGFCPSIHELEPIEKENVTFCGTFHHKSKENEKFSDTTNNDPPEPIEKKNKILVYMGNGTISASTMKKEITKAFKDTKYEVYIASQYLPEQTEGTIHIAKRWNFNELLKEAVLFIHHGGQNSIIDGLLHGTPQLVVPGKVFERRYNAEALKRNQAGAMISHTDFKASILRQQAEHLIQSKEVREHAEKLGKKLYLQGGIDTIIQWIHDHQEYQN